ncbi:glycosyltransferase family 4 protein [Senegalia sp. (in: firmicutes)]|uniref:glycosyltransferase family 4 protein n=1 Tax=Senegalia sp. (in: firmicutes) TaxID=1924098 RepID=UPI003F95AB55
MKKIIQLCAIDDAMNRLLKELNKEIIKDEYDLICVCSYGENTDNLRQEGFNIQNININRKIKPIANMKSIYNLYKFFKKEKPDIVHVHTPIASVLGRIAAKLAGVPNIIYTAHGFYFHENMPYIKYKSILTIEKIIAKCCTDYIFTQSEEDNLTAKENNFLNADRIINISNGVDVHGKFNPQNISLKQKQDLYEELNIYQDDFVITFIGRLVKEKGILDLLEAFKTIEDPKMKLLIIGAVNQDSRDLGTSNKIKNYLNDKRIKLLGKRDDVANVLSITDIFCLPSYREGMPRSIIEAMAMECAIISTNIRGPREEVIDGETGFLIPISSNEILSQKILMLAKDKELLNKMKKKSRNRAINLYDEKKVIETQLNLFNHLVSK